MRKLLLLSFLFWLFSCNDLVEKPDHLISKDKMSAILIDLVISEQINAINPKVNMEIETRYLLKKHHVTAKNFKENYQYYTLKKELPSIIEDVQEQLIKNYPELESKLKNRDNSKSDFINFDEEPPKSLNEIKLIEESNLDDTEELEKKLEILNKKNNK